MKGSLNNFLIFPHLRTNYHQQQTINFNRKTSGPKVSCPKFEQDLRSYSHIQTSLNTSYGTQSVQKQVNLSQHAKRSFDKSFGGSSNNVLMSLGRRSLQKPSNSIISLEYLNIVSKKIELLPIDEPAQPLQLSFQERSQLKEQFYASFARFDIELQRNIQRVHDYTQIKENYQQEQTSIQDSIQLDLDEQFLPTREMDIVTPAMYRNHLLPQFGSSALGEKNHQDDFNFLSNEDWNKPNLKKKPIEQLRQVKIQNKENQQTQNWAVPHKQIVNKKVTQKLKKIVKGAEEKFDPIDWSIFPYTLRESTLKSKQKKP